MVLEKVSETLEPITDRAVWIIGILAFLHIVAVLVMPQYTGLLVTLLIGLGWLLITIKGLDKEVSTKIAVFELLASVLLIVVGAGAFGIEVLTSVSSAVPLLAPFVATVGALAVMVGAGLGTTSIIGVTRNLLD